MGRCTFRPFRNIKNSTSCRKVCRIRSRAPSKQNYLGEPTSRPPLSWWPATPITSHHDRKCRGTARTYPTHCFDQGRQNIFCPGQISSHIPIWKIWKNQGITFARSDKSSWLWISCHHPCAAYWRQCKYVLFDSCEVVILVILGQMLGMKDWAKLVGPIIRLLIFCFCLTPLYRRHTLIYPFDIPPNIIICLQRFRRGRVRCELARSVIVSHRRKLLRISVTPYMVRVLFANQTNG